MSGRTHKSILTSHKTAIRRTKISAPMRMLLQKGLIHGRALDYGCGHGFDASAAGMEKYDPHWFPEIPEGDFDVIVCQYVLNTLHRKYWREILIDIQMRLRQMGQAYITVRKDIKQSGFTKCGTFQTRVELPLPVLYECLTFRVYALSKFSEIPRK